MYEKAPTEDEKFLDQAISNPAAVKIAHHGTVVLSGASGKDYLNLSNNTKVV
jgi:hypothetical protein